MRRARPITSRTAKAQAAAPLSEAQAERYRRKFLANRRAHKTCFVLAIVFAVVVVVDTVAIIVQLKGTDAMLWPWLLGWVVAASLAVHFFVKQGRSEICPKCHGHLIGFKQHCPWCRAEFGEHDTSCHACHGALSFEGKGLADLHFCTSCGLDLTGDGPASQAVVAPAKAADQTAEPTA